jgi:fibrillarin-like rRNA methylase
MKNSLTTSDIRDLTNEGTEFGVDNRAVNELLNEAQEREAFEQWLDDRRGDAIAHMEAKWAKQEEPDLRLDALTEG